MQRKQESRTNTAFLSISGLVVLLVGLIVMLWLPEIKLASWGIMLLGAILIVSALILDFRKVSRALTGRRGRFGAGTTLMASIFLGITLILNGISVNFYSRVDATGLLQFTLTERTKQILGEVEQKVTAYCFFVPSKDTIGTTTYAANLLAQYQQYTSFLTVKVIDPDEHPEQARKYGISADTQYQAVVFESGNKTRLVSQNNILTTDETGNLTGMEGEHSFTSAIMEVTGIAQKRIYFLSGHGEADLEQSYGRVLNGLRDNAYIVGTINLMTFPNIPEDTAVLVIASPKSPLTDAEIKTINDYLYKGGQALVMADPNFPANLDQIITNWGIDFVDGTVIDALSTVAPRNDVPLVPTSRNYFSQALGAPTLDGTARKSVPIISYFPGAVAVQPQENVSENIRQSLLVWTSALSWLEKNYGPDETPTYTDNVDIPGPVAIGYLVAGSMTEEQTKITRLIAIGDSDFASSEHYTQVNNADLLLNSINWLADETSLITIHRVAQPFRRLAVNADESNFITYSSLIIPPIIVLLVGGIVWWYRRS
jgi:ABC-type uncharacterized transport system involved in gliding motility auxiliary subunit